MEETRISPRFTNEGGGNGDRRTSAPSAAAGICGMRNALTRIARISRIQFLGAAKRIVVPANGGDTNFTKVHEWE
jgi:hypothetical protein